MRKPLEDERAFDVQEVEVYVYEQMFKVGIRLPIHPTIRDILAHLGLAPISAFSKCL